MDSSLEFLRHPADRYVLGKIRAPDKQVEIQFIQYSNDENVQDRLHYLDEDLPKDMESPQDLCDTTSADGTIVDSSGLGTFWEAGTELDDPFSFTSKTRRFHP